MKLRHEMTLPPINAGTFRRRLPIGAEVVQGGVHFRVWAEDSERVAIVFGGERRELVSEGNGYFSAFVAGMHAGERYMFRPSRADRDLPDPASRFQPDGPLGPSMIVDPERYAWGDAAWPGVGRSRQVLYEMHVGTFTREGSFAAAAAELDELARLGITVVELMPLAEFPGEFGWSYDAISFFAPSRLYGEPDDVRRFVDRAHAVGVGVILDVIYNHFGPEDELFTAFSKRYCSDCHQTEWGKSPNFDGAGSGPVREYFLCNARYWISEFHFDGLRLDATQNIYDESNDHIIAAIARTVRAAGGGRKTFLAAENEPQTTALVRDQSHGGLGLDALWNDDFHHSARVMLSGHNEAYYSDYRGSPQEFISAVKRGYLYQGQWYGWQQKWRGTCTCDLPPSAFINYIDNHDQIANTARGLRCHAITSPGRYRAMTALLLLGPATPLLFQGQEFASSSPFLYFADFPPEARAGVRQGRAKSLSQFPSIVASEIIDSFAEPADPETFRRCKLDFSERTAHAEVYTLHRELLRLRHDDVVFGEPRWNAIDGAVLGPEAFALRWFGPEGDDRLMLFNFGVDLPLVPMPEPLLAPPPGRRWRVLWSSEDPRYGGCGTPPLETDGRWQLTGQCALVLCPTGAGGVA